MRLFSNHPMRDASSSPSAPIAPRDHPFRPFRRAPTHHYPLGSPHPISRPLLRPKQSDHLATFLAAPAKLQTKNNRTTLPPRPPKSLRTPHHNPWCGIGVPPMDDPQAVLPRALPAQNTPHFETLP